MTEYQAAILRLPGRVTEEEELVTDLLNERSRIGWSLVTCTHVGRAKILFVFSRAA